jgi:hypothetical protein
VSKLIDPSRRPPLSAFEPNRWQSESPEGTCVETNTIATGEWAGWVGVRDSKDAGRRPSGSPLPGRSRAALRSSSGTANSEL